MIDHYFRSGNLASKKSEKNRGKSPFVDSTCMTFHLSIAWSIKSFIVCVWVGARCVFIFQKQYLFGFGLLFSKQFLFTSWCPFCVWIVVCISVVDVAVAVSVTVAFAEKCEYKQKKTCHRDVQHFQHWLPDYADGHVRSTLNGTCSLFFVLVLARLPLWRSQFSYCYCNKIQVTVLIIDINIT